MSVEGSLGVVYAGLSRAVLYGSGNAPDAGWNVHRRHTLLPCMPVANLVVTQVRSVQVQTYPAWQ